MEDNQNVFVYNRKTGSLTDDTSYRISKFLFEKTADFEWERYLTTRSTYRYLCLNDEGYQKYDFTNLT